MIKIILNSALFLFCLEVYTQLNLIPCINDSSKNFNLKLFVSDSEDFTCYLYECEENIISSELEVKRCDPFLVRYNHNQDVFIVDKSDGLVVDSLVIGTDKILSLTIEIVIRNDSFEITDLSTLELLEVITLKNLQEIEIKAPHEAFGKGFKINLHKWKMYDKLVYNKGLTSFKVTGYYSDKNLINDLTPFSELKKLKIPESLNHDLLSFKNIECVEIPNQRYFFSNYLIELPHLSFYGNNFKRSEQGVYQFYLDNINALSDPLNYSAKILPVKVLDSLMDLMVPHKLNGTGNVVVLCGDLKTNCLSESSTDTLAIGQVVNGKKAGVWQFYPMFDRSNNQYAYTYYHNFSTKEQITFPENGIWKYHHSNGVLAIHGSFKNHKKQGEWKFYNSEGKLTAIKTFNQDRPEGLFIEYFMFPNEERFIERRTYFYDLNNWVEVNVLKDSTLFFRSSYVPREFRKFYHFSNDGDLNILRKNQQKNKKIEQKSKKYNSLFYMHGIQLLFPEYKKGECPYIDRNN